MKRYPYYNIKIRRFRMKSEAVRLKGGKCSDCGWSGNIAAFQFHHKDPSKKEFTISTSPRVSWEKYWNEIEKCDLLCANCHAIRHSKNTAPQFLVDVENYKGRELVVSDVPWKNQVHIFVPKIYVCLTCKTPYEAIRKEQKYCSDECKNKGKRKCIRPTKKELQHMISVMPMTRIGKQYGVSDNAVRKWCKKYQVSI